MAIRTELIVPGTHFVNQQVYNGFIAIHGMVMILALIVAVAGPWGNFVMPIMIGARDMAFPRLNALSLWTLVSAAVLLVTVLAVGGLPVGWVVHGHHRRPSGCRHGLLCHGDRGLYCLDDGGEYQSRSRPSSRMRTKGMTLDRLPIFVWGTMITAVLALYAFPFFFVAEFEPDSRPHGLDELLRRGGWRDELAPGQPVLADGSPRGVRDLDSGGRRTVRDLLGHGAQAGVQLSHRGRRHGRALAVCPPWCGRTTCSPRAGRRRSAVPSW